jgi:septal ring-binding cell division protein DamX
MARQFAANPSGKFTVQIALVCQTSSITTALDGGGDRIWFTPTTYRGQSCYRLFWNRYETREAAERGIADIPAAVRSGANPVVVAIPR